MKKIFYHILFLTLIILPNITYAACISLKSMNLRFGSKDKEVYVLQKFLQDNNYLKINPTGYYGNDTKKAIERFQVNNGLSVVGSVGPMTRLKINTLSCASNNIVVSKPVSSTTTSAIIPGDLQIIDAGIYGNNTWSNSEKSSAVVTLKLKNTGAGELKIPAGTMFQIYKNGQPLSIEGLSVPYALSLSPGETYPFEKTFYTTKSYMNTILGNQYNAKFVFDTNNKVSEKDKTNNSFSMDAIFMNPNDIIYDMNESQPNVQMIDVDISPSSIRLVEGSVGYKELRLKTKILLKNTSPKLFEQYLGNQNSLFSAYLGTVSESNRINIWRGEFDSTNLIIPGNSEKELVYTMTKDLPDSHKAGVYNIIIYIDEHRLLPGVDSSKRNIIKSVYLNDIN